MAFDANQPIFRDLSEQRPLSPGQLIVPALLMVGAVFIVGGALLDWTLKGTPLPLSVLWSPLFAFTAWESVQAREGWSASTLQTLRRIGIVGLGLCALGFAYGLWEWRWRGGDPWFAAYALVLLIVMPLGWRRRSERARNLQLGIRN